MWKFLKANDAKDIDSNELVVNYYIRVAKPIEYIELNFKITKEGIDEQDNID